MWPLAEMVGAVLDVMADVQGVVVDVHKTSEVVAGMMVVNARVIRGCGTVVGVGGVNMAEVCRRRRRTRGR
jgi:hypothetical protein